MKNSTFKVNATVWLYPGKAAWHFITINETDSKEIKASYPWPRRGFGAIPVNVTIGNSTWKTSIFAEKKGTYLLPIKKEIRNKENVQEHDDVEVMLEVIV